jgi:hypothetical protein
MCGFKPVAAASVSSALALAGLAVGFDPVDILSARRCTALAGEELDRLEQVPPHKRDKDAQLEVPLHAARGEIATSFPITWAATWVGPLAEERAYRRNLAAGAGFARARSLRLFGARFPCPRKLQDFRGD